jgi:hypothetical protein
LSHPFPVLCVPSSWYTLCLNCLWGCVVIRYWCGSFCCHYQIARFCFQHVMDQKSPYRRCDWSHTDWWSCKLRTPLLYANFRQMVLHGTWLNAVCARALMSWLHIVTITWTPTSHQPSGESVFSLCKNVISLCVFVHSDISYYITLMISHTADKW